MDYFKGSFPTRIQGDNGKWVHRGPEEPSDNNLSSDTVRWSSRGEGKLKAISD